MNIGKEQYDNIPIPAQLDQVILEAIDKAAQENRRIRLRRWIASAAAVFCILFLSANITPIYAYASQIPVIGSVVRVLHIGTGGERTDGAYADTQTEGETVQFHFERKTCLCSRYPAGCDPRHYRMRRNDGRAGGNNGGNCDRTGEGTAPGGTCGG